MPNSQVEFIENAFSYHEPDAEAIAKHQMIRDSFRTLAHFVDGILPMGQEKTLVLTKLQEAMHHANHGIAVTQPIKNSPYENVELNER